MVHKQQKPKIRFPVLAAAEINTKNAVENKPTPFARLFDLTNGVGIINIIIQKNQDKSKRNMRIHFTHTPQC